MNNRIKNNRKYSLSVLLCLVLICGSIIHNGDFIVHLIAVIFAYNIKTKHTDAINFKTFKRLSFIFVLCLLQIVLLFFLNDISFQYLYRGISTSLYRICEIYLCYKLIRGYGIKALNYLSDALMVAYSITIIVAISKYGIWPVVNSCFALFTYGLNQVNNLETDSILESAHSTLLIMPLIAICYLIELRQRYSKEILFRLIMAIFISLLAYKRIAIGAAVLTFMIYYFNHIYNKIYIYISGFFIIAVLLCYIEFIKSGMIYLFSVEHDIDLNYRQILWPEFEQFYNLSINFIGQGWGFVSKYLHLHNEQLFGNNIGGLHNDILKIYIELGFIGFIVYFSFFIIYIPIYLYKKFGKNVSLYFYLCQLYLAIIYFTDNATIYPACQYIAYLAPFCIVAYCKNVSKIN